jgi:hypothetical protein
MEQTTVLEITLLARINEGDAGKSKRNPNPL